MIREIRTNIKKATESYGLVKHLPLKEEMPRSSLPVIKALLREEKKPMAQVSRYEMKYFVTESQAALIKRLMGPYMQLDRYCVGQPDNRYTLCSLYLDSKDLRLCRESLEGHKNRFKLRVRRYSDDPSSPSFFEIKRRMNNIIIKNRTLVKSSNIAQYLKASSQLTGANKKDDSTLDQFRLYAASICARPMVQVRYARQAYQGGVDGRIRVTFDRKLAFRVTSKPEVTLNGTRWQYYPMEGVILEIKFTDFYPPWLGHITRSMELHRQSISKYARSIQHTCGMKFDAPQKYTKGMV